jgi:predicted amidohydrolase
MSSTHPTVLVRDSLETDVAAIQAIYAHHVLHGTASFELTPPTLDDMRQRRADVVAKNLPYLVAEQNGVVVGYAERDGAARYNSAVAFSAEGVEVAHYRKIQLFGPRVTRLFAPGVGYAVCDLGGVKTALLICYDIEFAPHIAALAAQGVKLILCPTACPVPYNYVSRVTVPAHAANHGLTIAYANYCGVEGDCDYFGLSVIANPYGEIVAQAGGGPTLLVADVPFGFDATRLSTQVQDFRVI